MLSDESNCAMPRCRGGRVQDRHHPVADLDVLLRMHDLRQFSDLPVVLVRNGSAIY